jgi:hypothetical protein
MNVDDRVPEELRGHTDHVGNPLSLEQWQQIDAWANPQAVEPPAPGTPVSDERQYVLDCLTGLTVGADAPVWWPTHTPAEFGAILAAVAENDGERSVAAGWEALHAEREQVLAFDHSDWTDEPTVGRPSADVEAEERAAGLHDHDPVVILADEDDSPSTPAGPPLPAE